MNLSGFYTVVITLFILMAVGYFAYRLHIVDDTAANRLSKLIICIGQPCMIINAFVKYQYTKSDFINGFTVVGLGILLHALMAVIAFAACKVFRFRSFDEAKITEFAIIFGNCGFLGFPLMESLFGAEGLFLAAFFNISFQIGVWTWGIAIMARKRKDIRLTPKKILLNYGTVPCLIGIVIYLVSPYFTCPAPLASTFSYLAALCTPVSVVVTGALLATRKPKQIFADPQIYYLSAVKLLIIPLVVCLIAHFCGLNDNMTVFLTIMAAVPSASTVTMLAELYGISPGYASQAVGAPSLLSVATMPAVIALASLIIKI